MRLFRNGSRWGIILILVGLLLILRAIFNIYIPIFRPVAGLVLLALGIDMLVDAFTRKSGKNK